jgi:hypothetical protein
MARLKSVSPLIRRDGLTSTSSELALGDIRLTRLRRPFPRRPVAIPRARSRSRRRPTGRGRRERRHRRGADRVSSWLTTGLLDRRRARRSLDRWRRGSPLVARRHRAAGVPVERTILGLPSTAWPGGGSPEQVPRRRAAARSGPAGIRPPDRAAPVPTYDPVNRSTSSRCPTGGWRGDLSRHADEPDAEASTGAAIEAWLAQASGDRLQRGLPGTPA